MNLELHNEKTPYNADPTDRKGYVKIDRNLLKNCVFDNEKLLKVWVWCLLKATHDKHKEKIGLQTIELQPGQFVTGRFAAAAELKMNPSTVWKYLKVLEKDQKCNIKSNNKFSVVTLVNWEFYQEIKYPHDSKSDNNVTTTYQQRDTNKKDKKEKNEKKIHYAEFVSMTEAEHNKLVDKYGQAFIDRCIEVLDNYKGSKNKRYASDYRAILSWVVDRVREDQAKQPQLKGGDDLDDFIIQ